MFILKDLNYILTVAEIYCLSVVAAVLMGKLYNVTVDMKIGPHCLSAYTPLIPPLHKLMFIKY
jgi:hypothetical protein